jgi:1-acyl-sn-glycerol-3-phosphate acyltransferase
MAGVAPAELLSARKLAIYANHPSWWDGVAFLTLSRLLMPQRKVFAPIDAAMLRRYPFLARIGAFGVEQASARGASEFLATCRAALAADAPLMIAAQGRSCVWSRSRSNMRSGTRSSRRCWSGSARLSLRKIWPA